MTPMPHTPLLSRFVTAARHSPVSASLLSSMPVLQSWCAAQVGGINIFKDVNILASHLHGFYGNPGTDNIACDPLPDSSSDCYRGDNIFADILPGSCNYYQYDFADVASPGALW